MSPSFWLVIEIVCYSIWTIMIVSSIYFNVIQCKQNEEMFMQKRSLSVYYWLNASLIMTISGFMFMIISIFHSPKMIKIIACNITAAALWLLLYFLMIKNWMIYYKYKWTYYTIETEWLYIINSTSTSNKVDQNWYIKNNKKYGNLYYIYKLFAIYVFIGFIISDFAVIYVVILDFSVISLIIAVPIMFITFSGPAIFYLYLVTKTPFLDDAYSIHWESKIHSKLMLIMCIVFGIKNVFYIFFKDFHIFAIGTLIICFCLFVMNYVSTVYLSKRQQVMDDHSLDIKVAASITIDIILSDKKAMHSFMVHLSREYSIEILLSYIEFMQYQQYLIKYMQHNGIHHQDALKKIKLHNFSKKIPISEIIESKEEINISRNNVDNIDDNIFLLNAKMKAHKIYNKYIANGCEYEINISSNERNQLSNTLSDLSSLLSYNMNLIDLLLLFETCKTEMLKLQSFSLARFKTKNEFNIIALNIQ